MADWERELLDPEYALVKSKERYEASLSVLDDLVRSHINGNYRHASKFIDDLRAQTDAVAEALSWVRSDAHAVDLGKHHLNQRDSA